MQNVRTWPSLRNAGDIVNETDSIRTNEKFNHTNAVIDRIEKILDVHLDLRLSDGELSHLTIYDKDKIRYGVVFESNDTIMFLKRKNQDSKNGSRIRFDIGEIKSIDVSGNREIKVTLKDGSIDFYEGEEEPEPTYCEPKIIPEYDGTEKSLLENMHFFFTDEQLKDCIYFDELRQKLYFDKKLIGSSGLKEYDAADELTSPIIYLQEHLPKSKNGNYQRIIRQRLDNIVIKLGNENVRNLFLEKIKRTEPSIGFRCEDFLIDIGCNTNLTKGEENEVYLKAVSTAMFLAIIERLLSDGDTPPIKFVPVIIGETTKGKSTICSRLGLSHYYRQTTVSIDDEKRYNESVQGCVIAEMSEGVHMKAQNEETLKAFFDKVVYQYRKSYGRESKDIVKRYLEIITTNNNEILTDVTGNVRYYPIRYDLLEEPLIPIYEYTDEMILRYYADALELYYQGKRWQDYVNNPDVQKLAEKLRARATREVDGLFELQQVAEKLAPDVGDFVAYEDLRKGLYEYDDEFRFNEKKVEFLLRTFRKACDRFGFRKEENPHKTPSGKSVKGMVRIKTT